MGLRDKEESPWLKDQRRAPRSVRTPPPYGNINYSRHAKRQLPKDATNPFDSPSPSLGSRSNTTPASRNPSPSDGNRMLYTPPSSMQSPSAATDRGTSKRTNPFESPASMNRTGNEGNPFDSPAPRRSFGNNPFDESSVGSARPSMHRMAGKQISPNSFSPSIGSDAKEKSPACPQVRVTVQTQENNLPISSNKKPDLQPGSVALDSLEQILDVTEETTVDESDGVEEKDAWTDEPYHDDKKTASIGWNQQQYNGVSPDPSHSLPNTLMSTNPSFGSQNSFETSNGESQSTTTPSEKALKAAQTLKMSFQNRRRQTAGARNTTNNLENGEKQVHTRPKQEYGDLVLEYSQTEDSEILHGVAGRRRAAAEIKKSAPPSITNAELTTDQIALQAATGDQEFALSKATIAKFTHEADQNLNRDIEAITDSVASNNYSLHDLCDEAISTDDLAWHNALFLLTTQPDLARRVEPECKMTPLHVACLAQKPPPVWMIRGLLYASPETCQQADTGGRLPLHLLVATTADINAIRLLVEEYPPSVAHKDDRGFTPLQLLLKRNDSGGLTLEHLRLLLGQETKSERKNNKNHISFRQGDHLRNDIQLQNLLTSAKERQQRHEVIFREYPDDVRRALTKLCQWKRRQDNKHNFNHKQRIQFLQSRETAFVNPASIPTPNGQLLPLHLLVRGNGSCSRTLQTQDLHATKRASFVDLLRVVICAYPQGLISVDLNGKTPVMTALLQNDTSPSNEVIELLLGLRTPGFDGRNGSNRPAMIPTRDTLQTPLHAAAEELSSNHSLLSTICEVYPDARTMQDSRGRTPLHLAFQNYRSNDVDEHTLEVLFIEPVAKIRDNDGKTPLDLLLEHPGCVTRNPSKCNDINTRRPFGMILQQFFDASVERPKNRSESQVFSEKIQRFPPWMRRQACAARFVQDILVEEMASPFTTFRIMGSGIVLALLLVALRRMLHLDPDYTFLIYYLASYHLVVQVINLGTAIYIGEFFRLFAFNFWRWCDVATGILSMWCAIYISRQIIDFEDGAGTLISRLGASATIACWLSLVGYFVEWSCGLAVFIGSASQLLSVLVWPVGLAIIGFFATSQVLYTLEDCSNGNICSVSESYAMVYWTLLGRPVLTDNENELSTGIFVVILIFTVLSAWWICSVIAIVIAEAGRLDRKQLSLAWYWEPKMVLTIMGPSGKKRNKGEDLPSFVEQYCDTSEKIWHILVSAVRGERSEIHWDAFCFRSRPLLFCTGFLALFILPIWFSLGFVTLGILWPPQVRRWLFCPNPTRSTIFNGNSNVPTLHDDDLTRLKLSQLRSEVIDLKATTFDRNDQIHKDLGIIKDIIFRASMEDDIDFG